MKLKSLLLGTVAAAGLTSGAYAADLGVVLTALNVCDSLGISGLTISSDSNCLAISGGVSYEMKIGDYDLSQTYATSSLPGTHDHDDDSGLVDWNSTVEAWLRFEGSADSSFGKAMAVIEFEYTDAYSVIDGAFAGSTNALSVGEAYVSVGDSTMLIAGKTGSIGNFDQDAPLNYLGLFRSSMVDAGVSVAGPATGGHVIQIVSDLGNGVDVGLGLEAINSLAPTIIGVMNYSGDQISAHVTGAYDIVGGTWATHAGMEGSFDMFDLVAAAAFNGTNWNVLGSASATFDMFTIALSGEAADGAAANTVEFGVGGSVSAEVTDGITLNLGGRYFDADNTAANTETFEIEGQIVAALTETITATGTAGYIAENITPKDSIYFEGSLDWAPGGGFEAGVNAGGNDDGAYWLGFTASKDFE